jgi:putative tryptophan/tyrosine transport system substrate-binding protein
MRTSTLSRTSCDTAEVLESAEHAFDDVAAFVSYRPNFPELWRRCGDYIDRILRGKKPGDIPVEQPTKFDMVINLKTAKALALEIAPTLLPRTDEVIE